MSEMTITPTICIYFNKEMKFPQKQGRIWREAEFTLLMGIETTKEFYILMTDWYLLPKIIIKHSMK